MELCDERFIVKTHFKIKKVIYNWTADDTEVGINKDFHLQWMRNNYLLSLN